MKLGIIATTAAAFQLLGNYAAVGLQFKCKQDISETTMQQFVADLAQMSVTAEFVGSSSRDNKVLYKDIPLDMFSSMVNLGVAFITYESFSQSFFVNVPLSLYGALQLNKSMYINFTFNTGDGIIAKYDITAYGVGSLVPSDKAIRILKHSFRSGETQKLVLSGAKAMCFRNKKFALSRLKSVTGDILELDDVTYNFVKNTFGDIFIAGDSELFRAQTFANAITIPADLIVNAELEALSETEVYVVYETFENSEIEHKCNC